VIIPKAMAYAMMAGLPVQVRLYTALVPMVIYAVLGTSRVLSVSTTTTLAILTAAQLGQVVLVGTMKGIVVAIIVSLVTLAHQVADPPVYVLRRKPGTNVFRPQSPRTHEFA
jgi:MFS superfamily sulfate permease-like transporter